MKQYGGGYERTLTKWGYFFVSPFILVFLIFHLYPVIYTFMLSFSDLQGLRSSFKFTGAANFVRLLQDKYFWGAVQNTFIIWTFNFIPQLGIALLVAIWLTDAQLNLRGRSLFRAIIYMPNLLTAASVALLWRSLFAYPAGPLSTLLYYLGLHEETMRNGQVMYQTFNFFRNVPFTRGLVAFIQWWLWYGHTVIMLMAGITSISPSIFESAVVDGASRGQIARRITLPLLRPMMLYILITSMIGGMQMLDIPFLLTDMQGAPNFKIRTISVYLYNIAFQGRNDYAYAAAISIGVFIITIILALLIFFFLQDRSELKKRGL
jgi:multiple sugar transport system permease protein